MIDIEEINNITHGKYLWQSDTKYFANVGSYNVDFSAAIFGGQRTDSFVLGKDSDDPGDIITIEIDFEKDCISFTSERRGQTISAKLRSNLEAVKFVAEFAYCDSKMSFLPTV